MQKRKRRSPLFSLECAENFRDHARGLIIFREFGHIPKQLFYGFVEPSEGLSYEQRLLKKNVLKFRILNIIVHYTIVTICEQMKI